MRICQRIQLAPSFSLSRIVHGSWKLQDADFQTPQQLLDFIHECIELGLTSFDHADIYGSYTCEEKFGEALAIDRSIRRKIEIITKCGIALPSAKFPERTFKIYNYDSSYIINAVEQSLKNFHTDYLDLLLLHRPSPLMDLEKIARTFEDLKQQGKVLHFGTSNFLPIQFESLNTFCKNTPLITNQVEISPYQLDFFQNGNVHFLQKNKVLPMAWSPLASGKIVNAKLAETDEKAKRIITALEEVGSDIGIRELDVVSLAWLCSHPSSIIPVVGTCRIQRIKNAVRSLGHHLSAEQWFKIYNSSAGQALP